MQIITMYLRADSVNARLVDSYNQTISSLPALTRGMRAELILRLLDAEGEPLDGDLSAYASWDFVIADDWNTATPPQIRVTEGITVSGNEVHIPLTETNTEELISALGAVESKNFGCELAGFEVGETTPGFLIQFNISIRNRRGDAGTGSPVPVSDGNYSAAQIRALFAAKLEVQLSLLADPGSDRQRRGDRRGNHNGRKGGSSSNCQTLPVSECGGRPGMERSAPADHRSARTPFHDPDRNRHDRRGNDSCKHHQFRR